MQIETQELLLASLIIELRAVQEVGDYLIRTHLEQVVREVVVVVGDHCELGAVLELDEKRTGFGLHFKFLNFVILGNLRIRKPNDPLGLALNVLAAARGLHHHDSIPILADYYKLAYCNWVEHNLIKGVEVTEAHRFAL